VGSIAILLWICAVTALASAHEISLFSLGNFQTNVGESYLRSGALTYDCVMSSTAKIKNGFPPKVCVRCGLEFEWRKKWAKNWDEVKYCSERCRGNK